MTVATHRMGPLLSIIAVMTNGCDPRPSSVGEPAPPPVRIVVPPNDAAPGDPTWLPPRTADSTVVRTSFRIVDSRSSRVFEVSDGRFFPEYLSTGPRPQSPLARLYSDFSARALDGALWYHVDSTTGQLVDDLRANAPDPSELSCRFTEAAVLHCRVGARERSFSIAPGGTIATRESATVAGDTSWRVMPPPRTPDEARRVLLVFWHVLVIGYLSPPDPQ